jgi:hypothetical protein
MVNEMNMTLKMLILFSTLTILLGLGVVCALSFVVLPFSTNGSSNSQTLPVASTTKAKGVNDGLELSMTLQGTEYRLGDPINVSLTITNVSNQTVNFSLTASSWDFLVYNDTNSSVFEWLNSGRYFPFLFANVPLDPGMSLMNTFTWPQTFWNTTTASGSQVSPGTYYIFGQYGHSLQTTPIKIIIVGP